MARRQAPDTALRRCLAAAMLLAFAVLALGAATARAATVTLGPPLTNPTYMQSGFSGGPNTIFNTSLLNGKSPASPVDGTVVSWRVAAPDGSFGIQVLQKAGPDSYVSTGFVTSRQLNFDPAVSPSQAASLPIRKGEIVALIAGGGTSLDQANSGASARFSPALQTSITSGAPTATDIANNYIYDATVRYCLVPKLKGKPIKKARKALANADCSVGSVKRPKNKKARKRAKVVKNADVAPGTSLPDGSAVDLKLGKKPKKKT